MAFSENAYLRIFSCTYNTYIHTPDCSVSSHSRTRTLRVICAFVWILFISDQYRFMLLAILFSEAARDMTLNLRITHKTFICEFSLFHPALDII